MTEQTIKKMMETIDSFRDTIKDLKGEDNMISALTFTILDTAAGFIGVPTTEMLTKHMDLIETVNNDLGAVTF